MSNRIKLNPTNYWYCSTCTYMYTLYKYIYICYRIGYKIATWMLHYISISPTSRVGRLLFGSQVVQVFTVLEPNSPTFDLVFVVGVSQTSRRRCCRKLRTQMSDRKSQISVAYMKPIANTNIMRMWDLNMCIYNNIRKTIIGISLLLTIKVIVESLTQRSSWFCPSAWVWWLLLKLQ